jgi:hypothetical protein
MTETYYYLWEFFTSITILALIAIYIVYDRRQVKKEREEVSLKQKDGRRSLPGKNKNRI